MDVEPTWRIPDCDLFVRHRNDGATQDLVIPVALVCNTPTDILLDQVKTNSTKIDKWLCVQPERSEPVVLCGSGPSILDHIEDILALQASGAKVVALNNCANTLFERGIMPDYQIICDARPETVDLIGPAKEHLFSSQVHPSLFDACPDATLWHYQMCEDWADFEKYLPPRRGRYALVGGETAVGNISLCLAYTLGFRDMRCYGYDCSYKDGQSHAIRQTINDGEPITEVEFMGQTYTVSYTMKNKADSFYKHVMALEGAGAKIDVIGSGLLPAMFAWHRDTPLDERERIKYEMMWQSSKYRDFSPGEDLHDHIISELGIEPGETVLDLGCGPGRLTAKLATTYKATAVDFASNCLDEGVDVPFVEANLWDIPETLTADFGVCCDVMEHIPPEKVDDVLANVAKAIRKGVYFRIEFAPDCLGYLIGAPLHLSIHDEDWWAKKLHEHFGLVRVYGDGIFTAWR